MTETPTPAEIARWAALASAATPGPWTMTRRGIEAGYDDVLVGGRVECMTYCYGGSSTIEGDRLEADAAFIAAAREAVPRLLALVAAQAEQNAAACATCQGRNRATTDMVCMACGRDYMPDDGSDETGPGLGWLRLMQAWREQAKLIQANSDTLRAELSALRATDEYQRWARAVVERDAAREAVARVRALFAGGPDTPCRTVWQDGIECVSVPLDDLRAALEGGAAT